MTDKTLIQPNDMTDLVNLQQKWGQHSYEYGCFIYQTDITKSNYLKGFVEFKKAHKEIADKYGDGVFDLENGIFTPTEAKVTPKQKAKPPELPKLKGLK